MVMVLAVASTDSTTPLADAVETEGDSPAGAVAAGAGAAGVGVVAIVGLALSGEEQPANKTSGSKTVAIFMTFSC